MKGFKLLCLAGAIALVSSMDHAGAQENVISKKSKVTFTGRLHGQFHTSSVEGISPSSSFYVRRARLTAAYKNLPGTMEAKVQYDMGGGSAKLKDGYVDLKLDPRFNLRLGQYKKPFSLWELTSSTKTMVIERGNKLLGSRSKSSNQIIIKDGLYAGRDIGLMLHGKVADFKYYLVVFNGNGYHKKGDDDSGKLVGGRLTFSALEDLVVGASFSSRTVSEYVDPVEGDTTSTSFQAFEVDLDYGIKHHVSRSGPWVQAEFLYGSNPLYGDEAKFAGLTLVGSYNVKLAEGERFYSVRPALRFDYAKRDTDDGDTGNILLTPGVDIFFDKYNRVQINLDVNLPQKDGADAEMGLRVQFQTHI